ncbi:hypothetical protein [Micromonospora chokoriensis]
MTAGRIVLGLCFTHDSAAALFFDNALVGFAEEERLSGEKHTRAFPKRAVAWFLARARLDPSAVTEVAYNFDGERYLDALPATELWAQMPQTRDRAQARADSFRKVHARFGSRIVPWPQTLAGSGDTPAGSATRTRRGSRLSGWQNLFEYAD